MVLNATSVDSSEIEVTEPSQRAVPKRDVRFALTGQSVRAEVLNDNNEESSAEKKPRGLEEKLTASECT